MNMFQIVFLTYLQSTSAACVSGSCASSHHPLPPPINTLSSPPHPSQRSESTTHHLHTLTPSSNSPLPTPTTVTTITSPLPSTTHTYSTTKQQQVPGGKMSGDKSYTKTTTTLHTSSSESKLNSIKNTTRSTPQRNSSSLSLHGLRHNHHNRWTSPSPSAPPRRSSSLGGHHGSARTSPYVSPRTSPPGSRRGSPRNSHHGSPYTSPYHSPRNSIHGSPSPTCGSPTTATTSGSGSVFKYHSPKPVTSSSTVRTVDKPSAPSNQASNKNVNPPRMGDGPKLKNKNPSSVRSSSSSTTMTSSSPNNPPHSSTTGTQSSGPAYAPDFESGQVLDQLPFEYSSFLDLPPSAFGNNTCAFTTVLLQFTCMLLLHIYTCTHEVFCITDTYTCTCIIHNTEQLKELYMYMYILYSLK